MSKFSPEEIEKRKARLMAYRHLGPDVRSRKCSERKKKLKQDKAHQKTLVEEMAKLGIFVPVENWE